MEGESRTYARELEDLGGQVLQNGGNVDGGLGAHAHLVLGVLLEESLDATAGELHGRTGLAKRLFDGRDAG